MDGSDRIVSMLYIEKYIILSSTYSFITGKSKSKEIEHIKQITADFGAFKEEVGRNKYMQQDSDKYLIVEGEFGNCDIKEQKKYSSETNSCYWLIYDGLKNIISMNPCERLE